MVPPLLQCCSTFMGCVCWSHNLARRRLLAPMSPGEHKASYRQTHRSSRLSSPPAKTKAHDVGKLDTFLELRNITGGRPFNEMARWLVWINWYRADKRIGWPFIYINISLSSVQVGFATQCCLLNKATRPPGLAPLQLSHMVIRIHQAMIPFCCWCSSSGNEIIFSCRAPVFRKSNSTSEWAFQLSRSLCSASNG